MSNFIPNSFQVPNAVIDELMAEMSGVELKCYLLVIRKTKGWGKEQDTISIAQFMKFTGAGKTQVIEACKKLVDLGLLVKTIGKRNVSVYAANLFTNRTGSETEQVQKVNITGSETEQVTGSETEHTKNNIKNTIQNNTPLNPPVGETQGDSVAVLDYLNDRLAELGKAIEQPLPKFKPVPNTLKIIKARLAESSRAECETVVDYLVAKWGRDGKMREYLSPKTIFRASNFADYLPKSTAWAESGKPVAVNGKWMSEAEANRKAQIADMPSVDEVRGVYQRYLSTPTLFNRTDFRDLRKKFVYYCVIKTKNAHPTEHNINSVIAGNIKAVAEQIHDLPIPTLGA
ncbi:conserved phage C-terminal domain-containing protein [Actinobacillus pleuropneumoniae]|nr:conserved phage C-terminal domain-containing protein [Actinobacillus pleuropneumoniae]